MDALAIDHVNFRFPEDRLEEMVEFYCGALGFEPELLGRDEDGEPFVDHPSHFSVRIADGCLIHLTPSADPDVVNRYTDEARTGFDHVSIVVDEPIEEVRRRLEAADVEVHRDFEPGGATGVAPAVFVVDPAGYMLELKEDPDRRRERNDAIWERHQSGEDEAAIAEAFDVDPVVVRRVVTYRTEAAG